MNDPRTAPILILIAVGGLALLAATLTGNNALMVGALIVALVAVAASWRLQNSVEE